MQPKLLRRNEYRGVRKSVEKIMLQFSGFCDDVAF